MAEKDEFFLPEEVDRQIESVSQFKEGDRRDAEALAYLRNFYQADAQQEQDTLDRIWNRIAGAPLFEQDIYAIRHNNGGAASPNPTPPLSTARVPLKVTSVSMSVTPGSIAGLSCGTNVTVTYTALFHVVPNSVGGTVQFNYTVNNGRGQTPASITFNPGETTKAYTFTWSGALPADHTYPGPGGIQVTSPNQLTSQLVGPTGMCS